MKIAVARTYQPVEFERTLYTHFPEDRGPNKEPLQIELLENFAAISVKSPKDAVLIPLTNVAFMKPSDISEAPKKASSKK